MAIRIIKVDISGERLDAYLALRLDLTRSFVKQLIDNNRVLLNGKSVKCGKIIRLDDEISVDILEPESLDILPQKLDFEIIFEDDDLAIINKPQGMSVHPSGRIVTNTLVNALLYSLKNLSTINGVVRPGIVHRLDKDTSGIMIIAKNNMSHLDLSKQFSSRTVKKEYLAILEGKPKLNAGLIKTFIGRSERNRKLMTVTNDGKEAITEYRVLKQFNKNSLVSFNILTGRTHQIRVHAKYIGHPVVGDAQYGYKNCRFKFLKGQLLHSHSIEFDHPKTKERLHFEASMPDYFNKILEILSNESD